MLTIDAFFAGVGGIELGFTETEHFKVNYANEFDKYAVKTYKYNFKNPNSSLYNNDLIVDSQDIHSVTDVPDCDIMIGGFPCQAFSIAGYQKGFEDTRGTLFFEMLRLIKKKQPKVVFFENVKNLVSHDNGNTFKVIKEALMQNGYYIKYKVLNAKDYGNLPQNRERIYIVGFKDKTLYAKFEFPEKIPLTNTIDNVVAFDKTVDDKFYYTNRFKRYDLLKNEIVKPFTIYQLRRVYVRENKSNVCPTLTANMGTGGNNVPLILTKDRRIRKLTPKECFALQGYPVSYKLPDLANSHLYKQAGNSVAVPVIKRIAENIYKVWKEFEHE